jgi:transposase
MQLKDKMGKKGKGGRSFRYDFGLMRKVVFEYHNGEESISAICRRYNITDGCLYSWCKRYKSGQAPFDNVSLVDMPKKPLTEQEEELRRQNEELRKKLELANLKIAGLETMIDLAGEEMGVDIRKKPGTKQQ